MLETLYIAKSKKYAKRTVLTKSNRQRPAISGMRCGREEGYHSAH